MEKFWKYIHIQHKKYFQNHLFFILEQKTSQILFTSETKEQCIQKSYLHRNARIYPKMTRNIEQI